MPEVDDLEPVDETLVVIVAEDDGDFFCLVDDDGAPAVFKSGDPEVEERIKEARDDLRRDGPGAVGRRVQGATRGRGVSGTG